MPKFLLPAIAGLTLFWSAIAVAAQQTQSAPQSSQPQQQTGRMPSVHLPPGNSGLTTVINDAAVKTNSAPAGPLPPVVPAGRPSIGLVLDGGGALGLAHIGVLEWFEQHRIPVDRIAGTSMGSLIGALYASGDSAQQIAVIATGAQLPNIFHLLPDYSSLNYRRRQDRRELPGALEVGLKGGISLRNAVLSDRGLNAFLHTVFDRYSGQSLSFDNLPIPFRCVATDLNTLRPVVFDGGPLPQAVRASIAIPGVFPPVDYKGHYLVDGGIMDNLPVGIAKDNLRSDVTIAVLLPASAFAQGDVGSIVGVFARAFSAGTASNERLSEKQADVLLKPATEQFGTGDYDKAQQLIQLGYQSAEAERTKLLRYALSPSDWKAYEAAKASRKQPQPGALKTIEVAGGSPGAQQQTRRSLAALHGQPIRPQPLIQSLQAVQSNQTYEANFDTLAPGQGGPTNGTHSRGPDTGVLVNLEPARNGPPFLLVGLDASAMSDNVTRITTDLRLINSDFGGYGSELRSDVRLGFLTQATTEYYRLLRPDGLFVQPHLGILRKPVYIFHDQKRIDERFEQQAGGGIDFGRTFSPRLQLAGEWRAQTVRWRSELGGDRAPNLSGAAYSAVGHLIYDDRISGIISPSGFRVDLSAGSLYSAVSSESAPLLELHSLVTRTFGGRNTFALSLDANTYFRRNVADPLRFTLGGPLQLSASSINEYRGTDDGLVRFGYLRRIATLPTQLGDGLYLTTGYEAGEIWSPEQRSILRQDGLFGLLAATPIGAITLGGSVGDAGRRKVFFTFGRLF